MHTLQAHVEYEKNFWSTKVGAGERFDGWVCSPGDCWALAGCDSREQRRHPRGHVAERQALCTALLAPQRTCSCPLCTPLWCTPYPQMKLAGASSEALSTSKTEYDQFLADKSRLAAVRQQLATPGITEDQRKVLAIAEKTFKVGGGRGGGGGVGGGNACFAQLLLPPPLSPVVLLPACCTTLTSPSPVCCMTPPPPPPHHHHPSDLRC